MSDIARVDPASTAESKAHVVERDWSRAAFAWIVWGTVILGLAWSWYPAEMDRWTYLFTDAGNMAAYASGFLNPEFRDLDLYIEEMILTVQIALWGTVLSVAAAVPFAILSSNNMVPWYVYQPVRRLMDAFRAINEIVFAVLFVVAVGLGPFAGVMALFVHTTGILAKLFSEAVEAIDPRPVEGVRATGASKVQEVVYGVIPQVLPLWMSFSLYRFESNVRSATVLGLVGAGGIGQILFESIRGFYYAETATILIVVVVTVTLTDLVSQQLRRMVS
ncbi:MAG: phosphonate ABC transporter, permease protein PhnE [Pseudomonadota bacterium]